MRRLGVGDRLARTLTSTNPIESMISVGRSTTHNVKRWRDGTMVKRWAAAGMLNAERSFRRVKGCKEMPRLVEALLRHVDPAVTPSYDMRGPHRRRSGRHRTPTTFGTIDRSRGHAPQRPHSGRRSRGRTVAQGAADDQVDIVDGLGARAPGHRSGGAVPRTAPRGGLAAAGAGPMVPRAGRMCRSTLRRQPSSVLVYQRSPSHATYPFRVVLPPASRIEAGRKDR